MIHRGRWSSGLRGSLSPPLNNGFVSDLSQSVGENPVWKHTLKSLCNNDFAWGFFIASFGTKRKAFPSLDLSIAFDTSSNVISAFSKEESKGEPEICSSGESLSKSALSCEICSRKSSSNTSSGSSFIPLKHSEKSLYHFNNTSFLSLLIEPSSRMVSSRTCELFWVVSN